MGTLIHEPAGYSSQYGDPQRGQGKPNVAFSFHRVNLLPPELLVKTGPLDHANWNYQGLLGYLQRQRYNISQRLLPPGSLDRILEDGYGSGVFLTELQQHCHSLDCVDVHPHQDEVVHNLRQACVSATLHTASVESLPFDDRSFDVVVAVSTLEFVPDIARGAKEIARVLRPTGAAIVVTPGDHPLLDFALWLTTRQSAKRDFGDRRARLIPALLAEMRLDKRISFPFAFPGFPALYSALRLVESNTRAQAQAPPQ
jgi:SAM-dependent methyltransferase